MFSLSRNFLKFAAAGAFAALSVSGTSTCADERAQNLGPVGPGSPHGSGITSANSTSRQSGPLYIVTSDGGGNLATATAGQLGLATTRDVSNLQLQLNHLGRGGDGVRICTARVCPRGGNPVASTKPITQANRPLPAGELRHGRMMTGADAKPTQAGIAGP
jgi:hypothetical protein